MRKFSMASRSFPGKGSITAEEKVGAIERIGFYGFLLLGGLGAMWTSGRADRKILLGLLLFSTGIVRMGRYLLLPSIPLHLRDFKSLFIAILAGLSFFTVLFGGLCPTNLLPQP